MKKEKTTGNPDSREKERELTEAEKKRLAAFETLSEEMVEQGWKRTELTISIVRANIFSVLLLIPLFIIGIGLYLLAGKEISFSFGPGGALLLFVLFLAMVVVHELIHGLAWSVFTPHHFKDIEFGFMKQYLTPYCTCGVPLSRGQYIFGALAPMVALGLVPMAAGILCGSMAVLLLGIVMTDAAAGDILIVWKILRCKSSADEVMYIDHPTQGGGVLFEKNTRDDSH